jgi:2-hydroxy-3-oxopropionate reductase
MDKKNIGFVGVGIMGSHMATHLMQAGYSVTAFDINPTALDAIAEKGANRASSAAQASAGADIVITMVPDSPHVEAAALGPGGIIEAATEGMVHIDMSTIAPATSIRVARELGEKGVRCLDAPVSGGETGAMNATLSIMVGGPVDLFSEMLPLLEVMGKTVTHCGEAGAGQTVKACNQIQVALNFIGMAEAFVLGAKAGVDPEIILRVLSGGYAQTRVMDVRGPKIVKGEFEPGFKSRFHYKDLGIIMDTAKTLNVSLPASALAQQLFSSLLANGHGDLDHSAVIKAIEMLSNVTTGGKD